MRADRDLSKRLAVFVERGLIDEVPTVWQLLLGQIEMSPYVVMPDEGDKARYDGAVLGHPVLRQPLLLIEIGWEHLRVGHGLLASLEAQLKHLNFVYHEGMPVYDLQLLQTHEAGLERLREMMVEIDRDATPARARQRRLIDLVIPNAADYRRRFVEPGGYLDRAAAFDYPGPAADFLRPEFTSLVAFLRYCLVAFEPAPPRAPWRMARQVGDLATRRFRGVGVGAAA